MSRTLLGPASAVLAIFLGARAFLAQERAEGPEYKPNLPADHPAIQYGHAADDAASRLARGLERGTVTLDVHEAKLGVVPALLEKLHVSVDSQLLVFSKTSFQAPRISPAAPRALYFNDDVIVGYVPGGPTLEIAAIDPVHGPTFYSMTTGTKPAIVRSAACLRCHYGPNTAGVPGIYVGSVVPGPTGAPLRDDSAIVTDERSPFAVRWGGWYVTARRGEPPDRANAVAPNPADPAELVRESRQNLATLSGMVDTSQYAASSSDIVALMTFEHQTQMTNLITRVGWEARMVARKLSPSDVTVTEAMLDADIEDLVEYMLFSGEAPFNAPIEGTSSFARTFTARGPKDHLGRSLREFDLQRRLFRYPLSYMIYSESFDALPPVTHDRIYRRLFDVLSGRDRTPAFAHLSADDRRAIREILADTKPGLPGYWRNR